MESREIRMLLSGGLGICNSYSMRRSHLQGVRSWESHCLSVGTLDIGTSSFGIEGREEKIYTNWCCSSCLPFCLRGLW